MIVEDKIEIMAGRWPASIIRWLPFLAIKAELPLQVVLHVFSFSYLLFHFLVFVVLRWGMREKKLSDFYALWLLLISGHAFFWNNSELIQACSVLFIFMGLVKKEQSGLPRMLALFLNLVLLLFYHPLIIIPIVAVLIFWILQNKKRAKEYLSYTGIAILLYFAKTSMFTNWYDSGKQDAFKNNVEEYGLGILQSEGFLNNMQSFISGWNSVITLAALAAMYFFYKEKKWLCLLALPIGIILYNILIALADPKVSYTFYNEVNFIPLVAIILLGCMQLSHRVVANKILCLVLLLFFVFRISYDARFYTDRINYWESELSKVEEKTIKAESEVDMSKLLMSWASPYESILINHLGESRQEKTLLVHPKASDIKDRSNPTKFITHFKPYTMEEVNARYFNLTSKKGY